MVDVVQSTRSRSLEGFWMPFTAMRDFRENPRMLVKARRHHYTSEDGRQIYDSFSGLWTSGVGHCHAHIIGAVKKQLETLDVCCGFQVSHPKAFEFGQRLAKLAPDELSTVFFTNSGSEAADTALKIALAYHRAKGEPQRTRLIGRARGYHGVNFGGMSVGGIANNRRVFSASMIPGIDHLPHTLSLENNAFSRGLPNWGAHLADELERICEVHDASNIAAVIVEPVAGSTGVLPPPVGYLERLRQICDRHGILLIFDEVICAFGRLGEPFGAHRLGVTPDIITAAKGLTNGVIPMGAVIVKDQIHRAMMTGPSEIIELYHGYTYSGHPVACAAGLATLDVYEAESSFESARKLETLFEDCLHSLSEHPHVVDVRNFGLMGAIEVAPRKGEPAGGRALDVHKSAFWDESLIVRNGGETLQFAPFLNARPEDIEMTFEKVGRLLHEVK